MELFVAFLDMVGVISFALSGAMTAMRKNMDVFGVCVLGVTTAVGGGILRDVLLTDAYPEITTPYFKLFELMAFAKLGHIEAELKTKLLEIKD